MYDYENITGNIVVSENAQKSVIIKAINSCYGVVGISRPKGITFCSILFPNLFSNDGIIISNENDVVNIDVYIIVEYGTNFSVIANNLCSQIRFQLKQFCNLDVENINVHIKGLRKSR